MNKKNEDHLTLLDAFADLITKKGWKKRLSNQKMADYYAQKFKKGEQVPTERIREYLSEYGYKITQVEKWVLPADVKEPVGTTRKIQAERKNNIII